MLALIAVVLLLFFRIAPALAIVVFAILLVRAVTELSTRPYLHRRSLAFQKLLLARWLSWPWALIIGWDGDWTATKFAKKCE